MTTRTESRAPARTRWSTADRRSDPDRARRADSTAAPIVVGVDDTPAAGVAADTGVRLARDFDAPLVFVYVRRGPSAALGEPYYQRRLDTEMRTGRRVLARALAAAEREGVAATGEELAGNPARRVVEFARLRGARLVVLGSRRRRLGRSISRAVLKRADRPVLVAAGAAGVAA
jgi:nucleotide-binding universal stress UspA family protein